MSKGNGQTTIGAIAPIPASQLAVADVGARVLSNWLSVDEILARKQLIEDVMARVLSEGVHYGASFPGDKKKNLLKPGADTLLTVFQLVATHEVEVVELDGGHREYRVTAPIRTTGGVLVSTGIGSCSTMEAKHRWRWAKTRCPKCGSEALMRSRYAAGWYCNANRGGCGANVPDTEVAAPTASKVENPDVADVWNTCLKMAKKRAVVDGAISATGCSDIFGQDAEEHDDDADKGDDKAKDQGQQQRGTEDRSRAGGGRQAAAKTPAATGGGRGQSTAAGSAPAGAAAPDAAALIDQQLATAYEELQKAAGAGPALKIWSAWKQDQKQGRLDAMKRATAAIAAIRSHRGKDAGDQMLTEILLDRQDPDNGAGMVADLERASAPPPAAARAAPAPAAARAEIPADDEPPF
jgi:hypothetical protein